MNATIWIDVEDMFDYARDNPRPSGIQRLAFEVYAALQARQGSDAAGQGRVRFVRHRPAPDTFQEVPWQDVAHLFDSLCRGGTSHPRRVLTAANDGAAARWAALHRITQDKPQGLDRLPERLRGPLIRLSVLQPAALRAAREVLRALVRDDHRATAPPTARVVAVAPPRDPDMGFATQVRPGDVLLVLGAPWFDVQYGRLLARARRAHGLRTALLLYDLIPIRRPEWCDRSLVRQFAAWLNGVLPEVDALFAISRASAADVELYAREAGLTLPGPVRAVPIGTGFGLAADGAAVDDPEDADGLPLPGSYVLFVSTIEARKNHLLLFQVWRRLLDEMGTDAVPTLVFAGRIGWLVADLMQQLRNADYLGGRIVIVQDPSDADLRRLYDGCRFTVFPSLFEGWGLPVTESLALGKPCVIARGTSLPEAGGALARTFDPNSVGDACRVIRATLEDPADLAAWQQRVRDEFRVVPWLATADAILDGLLAVPA